MDQDDPNNRIESAVSLAHHSFQLPVSESGRIEIDGIGDKIQLLPGGQDDYVARDVLKALGAITVGRGGTGGIVQRPPDAPERCDHTRRLAHVLWQELRVNSQITRDRILSLSESEKLSMVTDGAVQLLKILQLAVGVVGPQGGIRLYEVLASEVEKLKEEVAAEEDLKDSNSERSHEDVYYPLARDLLERLDMQAHILGVRQRGDGEWSTPDVFGFYVRESPSLITPIVRIATVEVKHSLDRKGIAEAEAHKRFGHYAYIAVPTAIADINRDLITECVQRNLGLMCPRQRGSLTFYTYMHPPLHRPDEEVVEIFLRRFESEDGQTLSDLVFRETRALLGAIFRA